MITKITGTEGLNPSHSGPVNFLLSPAQPICSYGFSLCALDPQTIGYLAFRFPDIFSAHMDPQIIGFLTGRFSKRLNLHFTPQITNIVIF